MSDDTTRDHTRYNAEEAEKIFEAFKLKRNGDSHDLWEAQKYRSQLTSKETTALFDQWYGEGGNGLYEKDVTGLQYKGPQLTADHLARYLKEPRDQYKVFDIAAGSGLSGTELKRAGFSHVHWLDPSGIAKDIATKTGAYEKYFMDYLTDKPLDIPANTYDALVCVGAFFEGCLPLTSFIEMLRVVKPGGFVVLSISTKSLETCKEYKGRLEPRIHELIDEKKWEIAERIEEPHYLKDVPAVFYILRVL